MDWWATQPEAWAACRARSPAAGRGACRAYLAWLKALPGRPVFVGYPAAFDFLFVYWYLMRFAGESPFSHSALDIKTYAMALLRHRVPRHGQAAPCRSAGSRPHRHTHVALDDAIEQGLLFCAMLAEHTAAGSGR